MEWLTQVLPAFLVLAGMLFLPGWVLARSAGVRGLVAWAASPALSFAMFAVAVQVAARGDLTWRPGLALALVGGATLAGSGVLLAIRLAGALRRSKPTRPSQARRPATEVPGLGGARGAGLPPLPRPGLFAALWGLAAVIVVVPLVVGVRSPRYPMQQWDAVFHDNTIRLIADSGVVANIDSVFGDSVGAFYPTLWHSVMALVPLEHGLVPTAGISAATLAFLMVVAVLVWPLGIAAFVHAVFPASRVLVHASVAIVGGFASIPVLMYAYLKALWPNGTAVVLIPGVLALCICAARQARAAWRRRGAPSRGVRGPSCGAGGQSRGAAGQPPPARAALVALGVLTLVGFSGIFMVHPAGAVSFVVVASPLVATFAWRLGKRWWRSGHRAAVVVVGLTVVVGAAAAAYVAWHIPAVRSVVSYEQPMLRPYSVTAARLVFDWVITFWPANLLLSAALVLGMIRVWRRGPRWLVGMWAVVVLFAAVAAGWENPLRGILTGLWYKQAMRIETLYPIAAIPLIAIGLVQMSRWLARQWRARRGGAMPALSPLAWVLVASFVFSLGYNAPARAQYFAWTYQPEKLRWGVMVTSDELDLLEELPQIIGEDHRIIGSPFSGLTSGFALSGVRSVYLHLSPSGAGPARKYLRTHFRDIHDDPQVCAYLNDLDARYYYEDGAAAEQGDGWGNRDAVGFDDVDTSRGFELVTNAGSATVYRITACG